MVQEVNPEKHNSYNQHSGSHYGRHNSDILTTDVRNKLEGGYKGTYVHLLILKKFLYDEKRING